MKLMKHITIALVLCAIPAVAAAQDVSCDECTHVLSVYYGDGGLIAEADGDMVTYVASCEGVTRSGELMPNDDGVVSMLLDHDNHLACHGDDEDNSFEIGPVKDGGWYWLTMETNSAVGNLVSMDILGNETTMIANAGDGVTMVMGKGAVLLTETATGRTGLLPNILPTMEMEAVDPTVCGFARNAAGGAAGVAAGYSQVRNNCMMGDGGTITLATTTNGFTGATEMVANGGMVYRPAAGASGTVVVTVDLWGNHSGFFTTDPEWRSMARTAGVRRDGAEGVRPPDRCHDRRDSGGLRPGCGYGPQQSRGRHHPYGRHRLCHVHDRGGCGLLQCRRYRESQRHGQRDRDAREPRYRDSEHQGGRGRRKPPRRHLLHGRLPGGFGQHGPGAGAGEPVPDDRVREQPISLQS